MFQKIQTKLGPELLEPGTPVIYFPQKQDTEESLDLSAADNFHLYIVKDVKDEIVSLELQDGKLPSEQKENYGQILRKYFHELIEEGSWWTRLTF